MAGLCVGFVALCTAVGIFLIIVDKEIRDGVKYFVISMSAVAVVLFILGLLGTFILRLF